jgi:two-component system LytT family sensor kinase
MGSSVAATTVHVIGFSVGAALCGLLGFMQHRADRVEGETSAYLLLWVTGFVWTFGSFVQFGLLLAGVSDESPLIRLAELFAWTSTAIGPLVIARFLHLRFGADGLLVRPFSGYSCVVSLTQVLLLWQTWLAPDFFIDLTTYMRWSFYLALPQYTFALLIYELNRRHGIKRAARPAGRWFRRTALTLIVIQIAATLIGLQVEQLPALIKFVVDVISVQWVLPWTILVAVALAQTEYADLVLKRSLSLLVSVAVSAAVNAFLLNVPAGLPMVLATLSGTALILSAPPLLRATGRFVDRVLLRRPNYEAAVAPFEQATRRIGDEAEVLVSAARVIESTLEVNAALSARRATMEREQELLMCVMIEGSKEPHTWLEISATQGARTLMQQEFAFVRSICALASRRLEAIHFEGERRAVQLREERLKRLLTEAELRALRAQVDPHFLFNTLNTIADLIHRNPQQAETMTERLAGCFRYALSRQSHDLSTLDDELEFARQYLNIERVRFGERLRVHLSRGDARGDERIPSMILQPLVENAIKHGLAPVPQGGSVRVIAKREGDHLRLEVFDDGIGVRSADSGAGVGLRNVRDRLQTLYSQSGRMTIEANPDGRGTCVTLLVPICES